MKRIAGNGMLFESSDLNLIKLFFKSANFVQYKEYANVLKISSKCFYFTLIISVCYLPNGISKCYQYW